MEGVEKCLTSEAIHFFDIGIHKLFLDKSTSILAVTALRGSISMYIFSVYNNILYLIACFVNSSPEVPSEQHSYFKKIYFCARKIINNVQLYMRLRNIPI
jgi:hypothetical protein